jgi:hypothetical protein
MMPEEKAHDVPSVMKGYAVVEVHEGTPDDVRRPYATSAVQNGPDSRPPPTQYM